MSRAVLICGATGKQGGAVTRRLVAEQADLEILAVTRNADSPSAKRLLELSPSIKLVQGNLADSAALLKTAQATASVQIWGVFSIQVPTGFGQGGGGELGQGKALVDESLKAGVKIFVYTSVDRGGEDSSHNPTNIPHFISKHHIEQHLLRNAQSQSEGHTMDWVILRPVAFMDNMTDNFFGRFFATAWRMALGEKPLQLIAVSDIAYFASQAFLRPEEYAGRAISLAGDELTHSRMVEIFEAKTGRPLPYTYNLLCRLILWAVKDVGIMFKWFHDVGYRADIGGLRELHPGLLDFGTWLERESDFARKMPS